MLSRPCLHKILWDSKVTGFTGSHPKEDDLLLPPTDSWDLIWVSVVRAGLVSVSWLVLLQLSEKITAGSRVSVGTRSQGKNHKKSKLPSKIPN